ncbi:superoxide-generating NADPH oxidase flavocytochrome [Heterostelium album PN500]|uniref:Superoxide-generating NADPH oxidase flavocytochrome n=1 Tax=Heterostelium pallidum (strain ATCC 26659 / Pp 5 / PN500) TaxID=670386 RepID=D3AWB3_HETP5|nr:superoxide-generating NADPH oxidase flavocytochrome [Heterostelium album PN500]EFA86586.1 superoxide-generating NADPH oxidase flavocytochrome [Heterostelium album PN500]|eukprot:XP_020438691.1 superoxide-generating NADPH oxidase flavocytochrome [Heterostelium album PN500]
MDRMPSLNELRIFHNNVQIPLSQIQEIKNPHDIHSIRQLDQSLNELPHIGVNRSNSINRIMPDYQQIIIEKYKENEHIIREFIKCKNNESTTNDGNCNHDNRFILIDRNEFTALFKIEDVMLIDLIFHHFQYNDKSRATDRFTSTNNNNSNNNNNHHSNNINNSNSNNKHNISKNNLKDIITTNNVITTNNNNSNNIDNNNNNGNIVSCQDDKPSQSFINNYMSSSVESHNSALSSDTSSFSDSNNNNSKINILKRPIAGSFPIETPSFYNIPLQNTDSSQPTSLTNSPLEEQCNFTSTADNTPTIENNLNNIIENNNNNNNDNDNIDDNNNDDNDNDEDDDIENSSGSSSNNISSNISSSDSSNDDHNKSITTEQDNNNNNNNNSTINNDDVDINKNNKNNKQSSTKKDNKLFKKKAKKEKEKEKDKEKITSYVNLFDIINQIYLIMSNRGTKEDRIKSAFNLYDIYNRGFINRVDLKNVLAFRIKQNGLSISDMTLENLVDNVFEQFDKNKDGIIDFQEFQQEMLSIKDNEPTTKPIEQKKTTQGVKTYFNIEGINIISSHVCIYEKLQT